MRVLLLTVYLSTLLASLFLLSFLIWHRGRRGCGSLEQEALKPFDDETPNTRKSK